ncbi:hypothetical protein [Sediminibacterium sp. TEGAF015]|uniref:hypothetical protein n=1 Tax=Sediminibacterium sp. TEGAF015 TaxID=575378 RepID=UPI002208FC61|nr:hypothetical protein [Sediminibacterium sp. TEGAF015]BDQ13316.1 hypothetical protein TEGAF0_25330 [Sediminibacterium sp. TEGAF015]
MGHIKEPKGVNLIIASEPLTDKARKEISAFISSYKVSTNRRKVKAVKSSKKAKLTHSTT